MASNQPFTKSFTVCGALSTRSCRATSVSAMTLVAAVVETRMCASPSRAATAPERSGSHVTAASTCFALNAAAAWGASAVYTRFLLAVGRSAETAPTSRKNLVYTAEAPQAAAAFKAKQVDAAVTWEPDLSGAVAAREGEAHILVSTTAATNVIADTLVARQDLVDKAPQTVKDFVNGWFDAISVMRKTRRARTTSSAGR